MATSAPRPAPVASPGFDWWVGQYQADPRMRAAATPNTIAHMRSLYDAGLNQYVDASYRNGGWLNDPLMLSLPNMKSMGSGPDMAYIGGDMSDSGSYVRPEDYTARVTMGNQTATLQPYGNEANGQAAGTKLRFIGGMGPGEGLLQNAALGAFLASPALLAYGAGAMGTQGAGMTAGGGSGAAASGAALGSTGAPVGLGAYVPSATTAWATGAPATAGSITPGLMAGGMSSAAIPAAGNAASIAAEFGTEGPAGGYPVLSGTNTVDQTALAQGGAWGAGSSVPGPRDTWDIDAGAGSGSGGGVPNTPMSLGQYAGGLMDNARTAMSIGGRGLGFGGSGGGGLSKGLGTAILLKAGLGAFQNMQAQSAVEDELKKREELMNLQMGALTDPMRVPGLAQQARYANDLYTNQYRALHGGTQGGAYSKGLARYVNDTVQRGANQYAQTVGSAIGNTNPALGYNMQAGGTKLGAIAGPAGQALTDYALMSWLNGL